MSLHHNVGAVTGALTGKAVRTMSDAYSPGRTIELYVNVTNLGEGSGFGKRNFSDKIVTWVKECRESFVGRSKGTDEVKE